MQSSCYVFNSSLRTYYVDYRHFLLLLRVYLRLAGPVNAVSSRFV